MTKEIPHRWKVMAERLPSPRSGERACYYIVDGSRAGGGAGGWSMVGYERDGAQFKKILETREKFHRKVRAALEMELVAVSEALEAAMGERYNGEVYVCTDAQDVVDIGRSYLAARQVGDGEQVAKMRTRFTNEIKTGEAYARFFDCLDKVQEDLSKRADSPTAFSLEICHVPSQHNLAHKAAKSAASSLRRERYIS